MQVCARRTVSAGGALGRRRRAADALVACVVRALSSPAAVGGVLRTQPAACPANSSDVVGLVDVPRVDVAAAGLSVDEFRERFVVPKKPCVLTGALDDWPALTRWADPDYFARVAGDCVVPVECGGTYLDPGMHIEEMTLREFVARHIHGRSQEIGYLAQHQLLNQVPELLADVKIPPYVAAGRGDFHQISAWLGPARTVSPLHRDPYENLLAQVVGCKHITLFPPDQEKLLYPYPQFNLRNSSQVDIANPDLARFPLFAQTQPLACTIRAGDLLYLPLRYWHHIRAVPPSDPLSASMGPAFSASVSFWWR